MEMWAKVLHNICNIGTHGLPNMYPSALGPVALGPRGAHIRQTTHAHVTNTNCKHLQNKSYIYLSKVINKCSHWVEITHMYRVGITNTVQ